MIGVDKIGEIRRAYFEQHRSIKEIVRTLSVSWRGCASFVLYYSRDCRRAGRCPCRKRNTTGEQSRIG